VKQGKVTVCRLDLILFLYGTSICLQQFEFSIVYIIINLIDMKRSSSKGFVILCGLCFFFFVLSCNRSGDKVKSAEYSFSAQNELVCGPEVLDKAWYSSGNKAPLFSGLNGIHFSITTKSAETQKYFNQGMMLAYGFNHAEAARSFYEAGKQDSSCAMCWWGFAYVLGPNYNAGMEPDNLQRAYDAVQKAKRLSSSSTQMEKELIEALTFRYSNDNKIPRSVLDSVYASKMREVYGKYPDDANVAVLFAESLMNLHPWNLFTKDGTIQPWTTEIIAVLKNALIKDPLNAGANHFFIHAEEMSQNPGEALASADLLRDLVPGAGHLIHMPSHTYIRIGRYHEGALTNLKAVLVDSLYTEACNAQGVYPLAYYPHNYHFLAACATLCGESRNAIIGANETRLHAHRNLLLEPAWATLQHYYSIPFYIQVKLGLWKDIQLSAEPEKQLKYPRVIWHYAQGMAALSQDETASAKRHLRAMKSIMQDTTIKQLTIWGINNLYDLCMIASKTLEGEIQASKKNYYRAVALLGEAVVFEDVLNYNEPPDWFFSVRHNLGAILIEAGSYQEAIEVYNEDLESFPENGWALIGLMNAFEKLGEKDKFNEMKSRFEDAWKYADIKISSSRIL
jgi:tetratricopeptide (TPR) repeat protein